jgi:guanylate kinase
MIKKFISRDEFYDMHKICPKCKSTRVSQTLAGIPQYVDKDGNLTRDYEDNINRSTCFDCEWSGKVKDLLPHEEFSRDRLVIITGPSGTGKTTFKDMLCKLPIFKDCVTCTTREPRREEADGFHYHFRTPSEFKSMIERGEMLEYQEVYADKFYGTPMLSLEDVWSRRKVPVLVLDVAGAINVKEKFPSALLICIRVPNTQVIEKRLLERNTETPATIYERIKKSFSEMDMIDDSGLVDNYVMNDTLDKAFVMLRNIALSYVNELTLKDLSEEFEDNISYKVFIPTPGGKEQMMKSGREWKKLADTMGDHPVNIYHFQAKEITG